MIVLERPNFPPYVCVICGNSTNRKYFLSLDINLDHYYNPVNDGRIFYCNECWDNLITDATKLISQYLIGGGVYVNVPPTFDNQADLIIGTTYEVAQETAPVGSNESLFPELGDESGPGSSSEVVSTSSGTDADSNSSTDGSDPKPSDNPAVSEFLEHFGTTSTE